MKYGILFAFWWIFSVGVYAQLRVQGTVTDMGGTPMIGVNVIEKGTLNGTITDMSGNFTLTVESGESVLHFSYVGYITEEITVGNNRQINLEMREDTESLEEIVVVGYGTQAKKDITGSVAVVDTEQLLAST
ncbi:MAG: carboxypeptidase-like regulatory domain-containing protein, partial [Proteiniphilum sp.]|nr:carboxypeptidase-like regulatory domain-containing protein [Proteiniphilum sp.]